MQDYLNDSNKTSLLFKKFQNKTQTGIDYGNGGTSLYTEPQNSLNNIYNSDIFIEKIEKNLPDEYKLSSLDACGNIHGSVWNTNISDQDYSNSSFLIPNTNLKFYKEIYLNPVSGTNNAWWLIPPDSSNQIIDNNLLKDMIPFNFNTISLSTFSPIVKYWDVSGSGWRRQSQNNTDGLNWLIDYASGILQFYQNDLILGNLNIDCNSSDEKKRPRISFIKYVGRKGLDNLIDTLNELGDVTLTSVTTGDLLRYNGSNFVNTKIALDNNFTNVNFTSLTNGDLIKYNGINFINFAPTYLDGSGINDNYLIKVVDGEAIQTDMIQTSILNQSTTLNTYIPAGMFSILGGSIETELFDLTKRRMHLSTNGIINNIPANTANGITITSDGRVGIGVVNPQEDL